MNIDRHNYEEYFLLYVDNELSADQKRQVELFVRQNADLEEELVMLQQSRLVPDNTIVFEGKDVLMRAERDSFINMSNYEEWLVLYVDNELNAEEKIAVEKFAALHPHVRAELDLFQQTKLQPEELKFTDKKSLYRGEETGRVVRMVWWRAAAAAILVIAGGVGIYSVFNGNNRRADNPVAIQTGQSPVKAKVKEQPQQQAPSLIKTEVKEQVALVNPIKKSSREKVKNEQSTTHQADNNLPAENSTANLESRGRKAEIISDLTTAKSNSEISAAIIPVKLKPVVNDVGVTNEPPQTPNLVDYASNTDNENKRLRGIFRKATRFIERTSGINPANDDDRLLISAMAVNLK